MSDIVIKVENLSKQYRLGVISHGTLSQDLQSWWAQVRGTEDPNAKLDLSTAKQADELNEQFWALQDVSFEVRRGEILGIIGRNGAGKSTLLKILSRVTAPTSGSIKVKGRVASLLEVGTGFHPELTGRENVFLNGTILGMTKREIEDKFDEILAFAEIERFIDTPVKRYSSGMYVRLAFAVAAHLDPEILVVDEVLAVGDASFQKKCLGKMGEVAGEGRTVLFVSHNMGAVKQLCNKGLLIDSGRKKAYGEISETVQEYVSDSNKCLINYWSSSINSIKPLQVLEVYVVNHDDIRKSIFDLNEPIKIVIKHRCLQKLIGSVLLISIFHNGTELIHSFDTDIHSERLLIRNPGVYIDEIELPKKIFKADRKSVV